MLRFAFVGPRKGSELLSGTDAFILFLNIDQKECIKCPIHKSLFKRQ